MIELNQNNISTIASMIWGALYPIISYFGIQIDNILGTNIIYAIILLVLLVWSALNPNELKVFGNQSLGDEQ